ncbi:pyridoxal phosphate-dependent aminotransferase [Paenibacillus mesotrionivorans]|uniref:Pyridoxal phosphate-dependent aminotransferase n=1 Tax=Paenibacillus mesotrionivorans TaxID=3160968 RepID=A0ACC7NSW6_9BACL
MTTRLHLNENLFTYADSPVLAGLVNHINETSLYSDMEYKELKEVLADWLGFHENQLVLGNGSSELIQRIYMDYLGENGKAIYPWPSYVLYSELENIHGSPACRVPLDRNYKVDLQAIVDHINRETMLIILCNPNNPTGTVFTSKELNEFMSKVPDNVLVLVDEAYMDYVPNNKEYTALTLVNQWSNLLVVRSFSKLYGLASLRMGFAVGTEETASWLQSKLPNWNINRIAEAAAKSCLEHLTYFNQVRDQVHLERVWVYEQLSQLGYKAVPTLTNFIYVWDTESWLQSMLEQHGIKVKRLIESDCEAIRITIGRRQENELLINALKLLVSRR